MAKDFMYLTVIMDWYSRRGLAWRVSNTLDAESCIAALEEALRRYGPPAIFNRDQGTQYTSEAFTEVLRSHNIHISMDGKGRWVDNVYVERFGVASNTRISTCGRMKLRPPYAQG